MYDELVAALDAERVLQTPLALHVYGRDAGVYRGQPTVVVLPETTAEVVRVVEIANRHEVPVVARGAGTGLAAGAVATEGASCWSRPR